MSRPLRVRLLLAWVPPVMVACGSGEQTTAGPTQAAAAAAAAAVAVAPDLAALRDEPSVSALLDLLDRSHAVAREAGPHRLAYTGTFELVPPQYAGRPKVGDKRAPLQKLVDAFELRWVARPGEPPHFALHQENDNDHGRDVIVIDEDVYTRRKYGTWFLAPFETRLYERWLDEGEHCVHDIVQLAAPNLSLALVDSAPALRFELGYTTATDQSVRARVEHRAWHANTSISTIAGHISFEPTTGLWIDANIDVTYQLASEDGSTFTGHATLVAQRGPLDAAQPVDRPENAQPVPERPRYEAERERLLEGLGGR